MGFSAQWHHDDVSRYTENELSLMENILDEVVGELEVAGNVMAAPDQVEVTKNQIAVALFRYAADAKGNLANLKELVKSSLGGGAILSASNPDEAV